jgi:hypothetical protein
MPTANSAIAPTRGIGDVPPSSCRQQRCTDPDGAVEPKARDDARRERGAGQITTARRREGKPERERGEAVDLLQHEG